MKKRINISLSVVMILACATSNGQSSTKKKKTSAKAQTTVADILSRYSQRDRGANLQINKFSQLLPTTSLPQSNVVRNTISIKPPSSMNFFIKGSEKENQLEKILDDQIQDLYSLSQKFRKSPERGEIWLRLGELYVEKAKMVQMRIQNDLDKNIAAWEKKGRRGAPPKANSDAPYVYNKKAIELYDWYARDFPKSKKLDQAYFFLGYNFVELNQFKKGIFYYEKLTKEFPKSPYVTESHFALAEYYFDNNNYKKAEANYKNVLRDPGSRIYPFAMYKIAWAYYRLGQPAIAIHYLENVIEIAHADGSAQEKGDGHAVNRIRLADEAYNDLILFYPDVKPYQSASEYFSKMGGEDRLYSSLEKLGYLYSDHGQREAAKYVFDQLIEMKPQAAKNFDFQFQIVQNYYTGGNRQIFRQELFNWITNYNSDSDWAKANPKEVQKSYDTRESTLRGYILSEHKALQKSRNPIGQKLTKNLYELFIKEFSDSKNIAEMRFFYGELLYDMNDFDKASAQYKWVMLNAPESKYYSTSVLNELLALEKSLPSEAELDKTRGQSLDPFELNPAEKTFITAGDTYTKKFPKADKSLEIKFKIGRLYYSHNYFDQALAVFKDIVNKYPKTPFAVYSANLILDIYNLRKDYQGLTKMGQELLNTPGIKSSDINMDIQGVVEKAKFKEAQDIEGKKDYVEAGKNFENFSKMYPASKLAPIAKYNAAINYERAGDIPKAAALYGAFIATAPKDNEKQKREARRLLGRIYERTGQLKKAAEDFEKFAKDYPKDPLSSDLYYNSAVIWAGFKSYDRAVKNYENYFNTSKKQNRVDAIYLIADLYEKRGSLSLANKNFEKYIGSNPKNLALVVQAMYRIAKNSEKMGQTAKTEEYFKKIMAIHRRNGGDIGAHEAAEGQFRLTLKTLADIKAVRIPNNPREQGAAIKKKLAMINQLNQELSKVIKLDVGDYVIASLETAGEAYDNISAAIYRVPAPRGLNADQQKQYMTEVEKVAGPLKQQGIDNFKSAIQKARDIDIYNEWVTKSQASLDRLNKTQVVREEILNENNLSKAEL